MRFPSFLPSRPVRAVTLYSRPGCHLCDEARAMLARLGRRYPHAIQEIDIRGDPDLVRRYDLMIPVIAVEGRGEIHAPIRESDLKRLLR